MRMTLKETYSDIHVLYIIMLIGLCCNTDRSIMLYTTIADATINMHKSYHNIKEFHTYKHSANSNILQIKIHFIIRNIQSNQNYKLSNIHIPKNNA